MRPEKIEKKLELKFKFVLGLICATLFIISVIWTTFLAKKKDEEYPTIYRADNVSGTVTWVEKERSWIRVTLNDSMKLTIRRPTELVEFIRRFDGLVKMQDNDTIYVTREQTVHKFNIGNTNKYDRGETMNTKCKINDGI